MEDDPMTGVHEDLQMAYDRQKQLIAEAEELPYTIFATHLSLQRGLEFFRNGTLADRLLYPEKVLIDPAFVRAMGERFRTQAASGELIIGPADEFAESPVSCMFCGRMLCHGRDLIAVEGTHVVSTAYQTYVNMFPQCARDMEKDRREGKVFCRGCGTNAGNIQALPRPFDSMVAIFLKRSNITIPGVNMSSWVKKTSATLQLPGHPRARELSAGRPAQPSPPPQLSSPPMQQPQQPQQQHQESSPPSDRASPAAEGLQSPPQSQSQPPTSQDARPQQQRRVFSTVRQLAPMPGAETLPPEARYTPPPPAPIAVAAAAVAPLAEPPTTSAEQAERQALARGPRQQQQQPQQHGGGQQRGQARAAAERSYFHDKQQPAQSRADSASSWRGNGAWAPPTDRMRKQQQPREERPAGGDGLLSPPPAL